MKQIITLGIGQAGIQLSQSILQLYSIQHQLNHKSINSQQPNLKLSSSHTSLNPQSTSKYHHSPKNNQNLQVIFDQKQKSSTTARFMMVDTQPDVINNLCYSNIQSFLNPSYMLSNKQSANTYARGYYGSKLNNLQNFYQNNFKKIAQSCDSLQNWIFNHGMEGGTGSGTGILLAQIIAQLFPKISQTHFVISYQPALCNTPIGPYNTVLGLSKLSNYSNLSIMVDNHSLYQVFDKKLDIQNPNYKNINNLISQIQSSYTLPMRFNNNVLSCSIKDIQTSLVCYPRINWVMPSFVPLIAQKDQSLPWSNNITQKYMVQNSIDTKFQLFNRLQYRYSYYYYYYYRRQRRANAKLLASVLLGRGQINQRQLQQAVRQFHTPQQWVEFNPLWCKIGISEEKAVQYHLNNENKRIRKCMTALNSSLQFKDHFERVNKFYSRLYSKRSYLHWFYADGMQESQFRQSRQDMAALEKDYQQWNGSNERVNQN